MIKKIGITIAAMLAVVLVALSLSTPAGANTDPDYIEGQTAVEMPTEYQTEEEFMRLSQDYINFRGTSDCTAKVKDIVVPNPGNPDWNFSGTKHVIKGGLNYRACSSYAKVDKIFYRVKVTDNDDCGKWVPSGGPAVYQIDGYRMNGNAIANINPVMKEWTCEQGRNHYMAIAILDGDVVYPTDPGSVKCIAFEARVLATGDDSYGKSPSLCINFSQ